MEHVNQVKRGRPFGRRGNKGPAWLSKPERSPAQMKAMAAERDRIVEKQGFYATFQRSYSRW